MSKKIYRAEGFSLEDVYQVGAHRLAERAINPIMQPMSELLKTVVRALWDAQNAMANQGYCVTLRAADDHHPIMVGGYCITGSGVATSWMLFAPDVRAYAGGISAEIMAIAAEAMEANSLHRLQSYVPVSEGEFIRSWMEGPMGFVLEGTLRGFLGPGQDCWLFAREFAR